MENIGANILFISLTMAPFIAIIKFYLYTQFINNYPNRKYWKVKDIIINVIKFFISLIVVISWFVFISNFNISIGINQNILNHYLTFTVWVLGFTGTYFVYKLLKYCIYTIVGIIRLLIQRKSKSFNNELLSAINEEDVTATINNSKLLIQSNGFIDIGQAEFNKLLLMLFSAKEYELAHTISKNYITYSLETKKPKVARIPKTNKF